MKTDKNFRSYLAQIILGMKNVSGESCREKQNRKFILSNFFYENRAVCEIKWE